MKPTNINPKVAAGSLGGAGAVLIVWILSLFNLSPTPEVAAALTTILASLAGYFRSS